MKSAILRVAVSAAALAAGVGAALAIDSRGGNSAYGDWKTDAPGLIRKIGPEDVIAPGATPSTPNRSKVVPKPADA